MPLIGIKGNCQGFTLIELMVTLVIAVTIATAAIPTMQALIKGNRISTQVNDLISDLSFARSEAIRRAATVSICKQNAGTPSTPSCDTTVANLWSAGRVIFVNTNGDGDIDNGEEILRVRDPLEGSNRLAGTTVTVSSLTADTTNILLFQGNGQTTMGREGEWILCDSRGASEGRAIVINAFGRTRLPSKGKNMSNTAITCP